MDQWNNYYTTILQSNQIWSILNLILLEFNIFNTTVYIYGNCISYSPKLLGVCVEKLPLMGTNTFFGWVLLSFVIRNIVSTNISVVHFIRKGRRSNKHLFQIVWVWRINAERYISVRLERNFELIFDNNEINNCIYQQINLHLGIDFK